MKRAVSHESHTKHNQQSAVPAHFCHIKRGAVRHDTNVAALCVRQMQNPREPPSLVPAQMAAGQLFGVEEFQVPSWEDLAHVSRPPELKPDDFEPGGVPKRVAGRTTTQGVRDGAAHGQ